MNSAIKIQQFPPYWFAEFGKRNQICPDIAQSAKNN